MQADSPLNDWERPDRVHERLRNGLETADADADQHAQMRRATQLVSHDLV